MKWEKMGILFNPEVNIRKDFTHGANPFPVFISEHIVRIYYNCRYIDRKSYITYLDYDMKNKKIVYIYDKFLVEPGDPGLFDDSGCSLGCIIDAPDKKEKYMYYLGWNLLATVPWMNYIGLAIIEEDGSCHKYSNRPILERNEIDYLSCSYPYVMYDEGKYKMWYGSNLKWGKNKEDMNHVIKYAESDDGIHWKRDGIVCIKGKDESEYAFSKASVWKSNGIYKMLYSFRGEAYRIGYAESMNGTDWVRKDSESGIDVSDDGWDSETLDYPAMFEYKNEKYLLYCGNGYGKTGFGIAKLIEE